MLNSILSSVQLNVEPLYPPPPTTTINLPKIMCIVRDPTFNNLSNYSNSHKDLPSPKRVSRTADSDNKTLIVEKLQLWISERRRKKHCGGFWNYFDSFVYICPVKLYHLFKILVNSRQYRFFIVELNFFY